MNLPQITQIKGIRVLTTKQIAEKYGTNETTIRTNFSRNRLKFVEGKHYIALAGDELREFKNSVTQCNAVKNNDITKCNAVGTRTNLLYLWTEKGALLHAKSLNTDKAWEAYEYLVDFYFHTKEEKPEPVKKELLPPNPMMQTVVDIPENPKAQDAIKDLKKALNAIEIMVDESNRYVSETKYQCYSDGIMEMVAALMGRVNAYLNIKPKLIEKQY